MTRLRVALLGLVLVTACSSGSSKVEGHAVASSGASAASATPSAFCSAIALVGASTISAVGADEALDPLVASAGLAKLNGITPPPEIKGAWADFLTYLRAVANISPPDPSAALRALKNLGPQQYQSVTKVVAYAAATCHFPGLGASNSSALESIDSELSSLSSSVDQATVGTGS